jgi:sulfur-carrier protein
MSVRIFYFAGLKESLGVAEESIDLPAGVATLGALRDWLVAERGHAALGTARNLRCARNQSMARFDAALADGDEIAFFPPVTGG